MTIGDKIRKRRKELGLSQEQLALRVGYGTKGAIANIENGHRAPPRDHIPALSAALGIPLAEFFHGTVPGPHPGPAAMVPVFSSVHAGDPTTAVEDVIGYELVDGSAPDVYALRVKGDSMSPQILEGDVLIVQKQSTADSGDIVIALLGDEACVKKMTVTDEGVLLLPLNPAYSPIFLPGGSGGAIIGKVIELRRKM